MKSFQEYLNRKYREHGDKFSVVELSGQFIPYYNSGQRIIVKNKWGDITRGYVGVTTGWKPSFLLMLRSNSMGSSILLSDNDTIIGTVNKYR